MFSHEKLDVYQCSLEFLAFAMTIINNLGANLNELKSQFQRASLSIPLNIAEGVGRTGEKDQCRFYAIARGSAFECAAILDACKIISPKTPVDMSAGKQLQVRIIAMLTKMCKPNFNGL